jgi:hypothetical protein
MESGSRPEVLDAQSLVDDAQTVNWHSRDELTSVRVEPP